MQLITLFCTHCGPLGQDYDSAIDWAGDWLTEKWRQKLMMIRRSRRTLSYPLFAPSNKLVWTDEGLRKFMFFSPILSEPITVSWDTRETSNPWNEQDGGLIELAVHVAFNRSVFPCRLWKIQNLLKARYHFFMSGPVLVIELGALDEFHGQCKKRLYVFNSTFSLQSEMLPNKFMICR